MFSRGPVAAKKMELVHAGLLFLLFSSTNSFQFRRGSGYSPFVQDPELEWERIEKVIDEERPEPPAPRPKFWKSLSDSEPLTPEAKKVPEYVVVSASDIQKEVFKPEKGTRPLPNSIKEMLLAATATTPTKASSTPKLIEVLCHADRMYVRIRREYFKITNAYKYLKLGTCPVNQGTKEHYYFLYLLTADCGFKRESGGDDLNIQTLLSYDPAGPVVRDLDFKIPVKCNFPRYFHSFQVGIHPKRQGGTVFKALLPKSSFSLIPQDASGNPLTGSKTYTLGQPMYFLAKMPDSTSTSGNQRLYINKCYTTASQNPNSSPKYTVIANQGCMVDGKISIQSKFLTSASKMVQKFSLGSMVFKDKISDSSKLQQLYMHCDITMGKLTPTPSSKACDFDVATKKWKELYGDDSVCTCCETTCPTAQPRASRNMISSHSWTIDLKSRTSSDSSDADTFSLENPAMAEHEDFLNYWENDY